MSIFESTENYIKMYNSIREDIIKFISGAFDSGLSVKDWNNLIIADELKYIIKHKSPQGQATSDKELFIIAKMPEQAQEVPYLLVNNVELKVEDMISMSGEIDEGTYVDDNDEDKKAVILGGILSGSLKIEVGAYSQRERNDLLSWLLMYFKIGKDILMKGSDLLEIDGNFNVGAFKLQGGDSPSKILHNRQLWKGTMSFDVQGFWEIFMPLEGVWNGIVVDENNFLSEVQTFYLG